MIKMTFSLLIGASLALLGPQFVHARGCGGARASGGSFSGSRSFSGASDGRYGGASGSYNRSYEGSHGGSYEASGTRGAAYGPNGAAAGSTRDVSATGPKGQTYNSQEERGAAAGPNGAVAGGSRDTSATGANGQSYSGQREGAAAVGPYGAAATGSYHGTAAYSTAHVALPTDAGYGASVAGAGSAVHAGYHQTEAVSGSVYAARGAAVRTSFNGYGMYGADWHAANPGAWSAAGWKAGYAWTPATWPAVGVSLGWAANTQPFAYNYGSDVTYQNDQVYYGSQPVATAEQYYQQAATLSQTAPATDAPVDEWMPLGVFALVQKEQSDPQFVMQLAVNKSGAIGGNYTDMISGTNAVIQGAVDKKSQRAAWTVGKNKNTVCEAGLYNLTKDEAPVLIHIGKDKTQQWMLVRLKQPQPAGSGK
jgi:hypothetical protein